LLLHKLLYALTFLSTPAKDGALHLPSLLLPDSLLVGIMESMMCRPTLRKNNLFDFIAIFLLLTGFEVYF
jgi:hypothetical protein